jgi:putative colanic acid biosysnthesis UDP-glucose lipid carrier transferase
VECRERYEEEWESGLSEIPGEIFKFFYSLGLLRAASGICKAVPNGLTTTRSHVVYDSAKRILEVGFSIMALALLSPVLVAVAIAIKLDSPGPALLRLKRIGKGGAEFTCFKFRTTDIQDPSNPRVGKLSRFLRRFALDELPQFFNVLRGDMSIVGPRRPLTLILNQELRNKLQNSFSKPPRLDVPPGVIGLSQLSELRGTQYDENDRLTLDAAYIHLRGFWLDFKILSCAIWAAIFRV